MNRLYGPRPSWHRQTGFQRGKRRVPLAPDAGDDVVDIGTKTFAREQELALAGSIRVSLGQIEHALERLAAGGYGCCEACGESIPAARLAAFPSATLCVGCKQRQERH